MRKLVFLALTLVLSMALMAEWNFRGTPNSWASEAMTYNSTTGLYETTQSFNSGDGGGGPRFKIDRYGDWTESYPAGDYTVNSNTTYDITINPSTHEITATESGTPIETWYFRGTPNSWGLTAMTYNESTGLYELVQTFADGDSSGGPRFKIDNGSWTESYPAGDYTVTGNNTYTITFDGTSHTINAVAGISLPTVSATPAGGSYTADSISVTVSASGDSISASSYQIDSSSAVSFSGTAIISLDMSGLVNGETKTVRVSATNTAGTATETYTFTRIVEVIPAPTVSATPASGDYTTDSISVTVTASGTGISSSTYQIDSNSAVSFSGTAAFNLDMSGLAVGETKTVRVSATNTTGTSTEIYTYTKAAAPTGITVYFENTNNWSNVYLYAYTDSGAVVKYTGEWPGTLMTDIGDNWYSYDLGDLSEVRVIFTDNAGNQVPGSGQAGELLTATAWYNGTWNDTDPRIDIQVPTIKTNPTAGVFEETTLSIELVTEDNQDANPVTYYTIDGSTPVIGQSAVYSSALIANDMGSEVDFTVKAIAVDVDNNQSTVYTFEFKLNEDATAPVVTSNPQAGLYAEGAILDVTLGITDNKDSNPSLYYTTDNTDPQKTSAYLYGGESIYIDASTTIKYIAVDNNGNEKYGNLRYTIGNARTDFREESIYFLMTARFYDGDSSNNRYTRAGLNAGADAINDPAWRGDFKGLIEKLDYIKAMGFTAIWITPPVLNRSDCDYHGYHAWDMRKIDGRLESEGATYQDLIDAIHAKGMKVIQDVVINHSGKYGEKNLGGRILWGDSEDPQWGAGMEADYYDVENPNFEYNGVDIEPMSGKNYYTGGTYQAEKPTAEQLPWLYDGDDSYMDPYLWIKGPADLQPNLDTWGQVFGVTEEQWDWRAFQWSEYAYTLLNPEIYHLINLGNWEAYDCQQGTMHPDCVDLNTESATVQDYLIDTYNQYIDMGVDAFRIDTAKHISRTMFNRHFVPAWKERGGENFYMFGEVLVKSYDLYPNGAIPLGAPFYTWKEGAIDQSNGVGDQLDPIDWKAAKEGYDTEQAKGEAGQPHSNNHYLNGNNYHTPDYSQKSGLDIIDMQAHVNFSSAGKVWGIKDKDSYYNDATWNVVYVDSHDYGPSTSSNRFAGSTEQWAENFNLMFTWRGIPCVYYGSEIRFKAGAPTDGDPNKLLLEESGRAYYGDHIEGTIDVTDFSEWSNATGELAVTMDSPLVKHLAALNKIRRAVPALQKGQYSTDNIDGYMAFKKRYTNLEENVDSFVLVAISSSATFNGIPGGTYIDAVTGDSITVSEGGSLTANVSGQGKMRVYVLDLPNGPAPGKLAGNGDLLE